MPTAAQIAIVRRSFADVLPVADAVAALFYARLFQLAPDTRPLFTGDPIVQGDKLIVTLAAVVEALDRFDAVAPTARALALRHVDYGAREHHYAVVGIALLDTLRLTLGRRFDAETEAAWAAAYQMLADTMIDAARRAA